MTVRRRIQVIDSISDNDLIGYIAYTDWGDGVIISSEVFQTRCEAEAGLEKIFQEFAEVNRLKYIPPESPQRDAFEILLLNRAGVLHFGVEPVKLNWIKKEVEQ